MKGNNSILHHDIIYLFCCERDNLIHFVAVRNFFFPMKEPIRSKKGEDFTLEEMGNLSITKRTLNVYVENTQRNKAE